MPEHYTKLTVEASIWCNKCRKMTMWRIAGGKRSHCLECYVKIPEHAVKAAVKPADPQMNLFNERK